MISWIINLVLCLIWFACWVIPLFAILAYLHNGVWDAYKLDNIQRIFHIKSEYKARYITSFVIMILCIVSAIASSYLMYNNMFIVFRAISIANGVLHLFLTILFRVRGQSI